MSVTIGLSLVLVTHPHGAVCQASNTLSCTDCTAGYTEGKWSAISTTLERGRKKGKEKQRRAERDRERDSEKVVEAIDSTQSVLADILLQLIHLSLSRHMEFVVS